MNRPNTKKQQDQFDYIFIKMPLIGDSGVGKTNIMMRFCDGSYKATHMATVGVDFKMKVVTVEDVQLRLQVWDTAGQEKYLTITNSMYNGSSAVIIVYSVTDRRSFENVRMWMKQISDNVSESMVKVIIGNKCDLDDSFRKVTFQEGKDIANEYGISFFETSAFDNIGIQEAFYEIARQIKVNQFANDIEGLGSGNPFVRSNTPTIEKRKSSFRLQTQKQRKSQIDITEIKEQSQEEQTTNQNCAC